MILKKPYAFFIKMFKPIHLVLSMLVIYLITLENKILNLFSNYIKNVSFQELSIDGYVINNYIYIIPIILIISFLIILGIMYNKGKSFAFYLVGSIVLIAVIIINVYAVNFTGSLESQAVAIKTVKLMHDLIFLNIIIEAVLFIFLLIRGMGIDVKKFDFSSDLSHMEISESDREEYEVSINVDIDEIKKRRRNRYRKLNYFYKENKFMVNIGISIILIIIIGISTFSYIKVNNKKKEGVMHYIDGFNFIVDKTYLLNTGFDGEKLTDNYLVVINTRLTSGVLNKSLYVKDFSLIVDDIRLKPTLQYSDNLIDIGKVYDEETLTEEYEQYLFIYEVPKEYISKKMIFRYINKGEEIDVKLKPNEYISKKLSVNKKMGEDINFKESIGDIGFRINSYEIKDKYKIEYDYCINEKDCIKSVEYLKPTINTNFDKYILRLDLDYTNNSKLDIDTLYDLITDFGYIEYKIDNTWYTQKYKIEKINSNKKKLKELYLGVNSNIALASNIKLIFNIRDAKYEYEIKGDI